MTPADGPLWTAPEAAAAVGGAWHGGPRDPGGVSLTGVSIDTRTLAPGELFVALAGPNRDGHDFARAALEAGAAAVLASRVPEGLDAAPLILVDDTQAALERLGKAARARVPGLVAGVTGSVGKTGTKEMLALALGASGRVHRSAGSYNNLWGVPLSLARMPRDTRFGVFEIGMNHAGEIAPLTAQIRPHVAIVTTIEPVHLAFFATIEAIADAKAEIFQGVEPGGAAILNSDNAQFARLEEAARTRGIERVLGFGTGEAAFARLVSAALEPGGSLVEAVIGGHPVRYRLGQPGRHLVMNSLAVLAAVEAMGADLDAAARSLAGFEVPAGRGRRLSIEVAGGSAVLLDESYNASPASMQAAFEVLATVEPAPGGRRIAVLGDMRELGALAPSLHRELAPAIERAHIDLLFACGPLMGHLYAALTPGLWGLHAPSAERLLPSLATALRPGDVVMVKGSLGSRMTDIVTPLTEGRAARQPQRASPC